SAASGSVKVSGDVLAGEIWTTWPGIVTDSATATDTPLERAPTIATTPSVLASWRARSTPCEGLVPSSSVTISISGPPNTAVAAALICSAASIAPLLIAGQNSARAPVYDIRVPTFDTGGCASARPARATAKTHSALFIDVSPPSFAVLR